MKTMLIAGAFGAVIASSQTMADDFECSSTNLMKHVGEQTQQIEAYISQSDDPQQTQRDLTNMARGLRESGQVSNHDEEMKKLASGADFQPSRSFCDDMQTTITAIQTYMENHP